MDDVFVHLHHFKAGFVPPEHLCKKGPSKLNDKRGKRNETTMPEKDTRREKKCSAKKRGKKIGNTDESRKERILFL